MKTIYEIEVNNLMNIQDNIIDLEDVFSDKLNSLIKVYEKQRDAIQSEINSLWEQFNCMELTARQLNDMQPQKGLFGDIKVVSLEDIQNLKKWPWHMCKLK